MRITRLVRIARASVGNGRLVANVRDESMLRLAFTRRRVGVARNHCRKIAVNSTGRQVACSAAAGRPKFFQNVNLWHSAG